MTDLSLEIGEAMPEGPETFNRMPLAVIYYDMIDNSDDRQYVFNFLCRAGGIDVDWSEEDRLANEAEREHLRFMRAVEAAEGIAA